MNWSLKNCPPTCRRSKEPCHLRGAAWKKRAHKKMETQALTRYRVSVSYSVRSDSLWSHGPYRRRGTDADSKCTHTPNQWQPAKFVGPQQRRKQNSPSECFHNPKHMGIPWKLIPTQNRLTLKNKNKPLQEEINHQRGAWQKGNLHSKNER